MPYKPHDIPETFSVLGVAFIIGVIAQFLRQKTDESVSNKNILWLSLASGFSAMVAVGLMYEYTDISGAFLVAISGLAGWAGISILSTLSKTFDQLLIKGAEKKLDIKIVKEQLNPVEEKGVSDNVPTSTAIGSQTE